MNKITLVQPRHIYAPKEGNGHIHLSAPLITAGARMEASRMMLLRLTQWG